MNFIKAIIFGIIEGITEWMPISSTAHMKILNVFLPLEVSGEFYEVFEVVIQLGAILALLLVFWNKVWPFGRSDNPLGKGALSDIKKDKFFLWLKIIIACMPAIVFELFLDDKFNFVNESNEMKVIGVSLLVVGFVFLLVEMIVRNKKFTVSNTKRITFLQAIVIGLAQLIAAIFPGVSRSGATIIAALLIGISRSTATEFTFELAIPVMFGASLMKILKYGMAFSAADIMLLLFGCVSAFMVSLFMIRFVLNYVKRNTFTVFGIYRVLMGLIVLILLK
ncbi:MAG: undecaprenyl-diphosphate phosphatase [Erysipelotrichaceae bacterium]|nr:undecaprenyl-diphosphate phosphatase [Erysipelotrichaceae bacterium]